MTVKATDLVIYHLLAVFYIEHGTKCSQKFMKEIHTSIETGKKMTLSEKKQKKGEKRTQKKR
jgi:hypothetical protein